jgi:flagellar export protein FliJ
MKPRNTLVRLHKWQVDEKRRHLATLYALRDEFERKLLAVAETVAREQAFVNSAAGSSEDVGFSYGAFAQAAIMQQDNIQRSMQSLDEQIVEALEAVGDAFKSLKRYEIAAANQAARKDKARARIEQIETDDQAIESHQRKVART